MMPHGKTFLCGRAGTVQGRLAWADREMAEFCPVVEQIIKDTDWLQRSGFDTIHYVMRFGAERQLTIECRKRAKYQELEVSSQESMARLHDVLLDRRQLRCFLAAEV